MRFNPNKILNVSPSYCIFESAQCSCCGDFIRFEKFWEIVEQNYTGFSPRHPLGDGFCTKCCKTIEEADERVRNWVPPPPPQLCN
jgi:hypothetical protein